MWCEMCVCAIVKLKECVGGLGEHRGFPWGDSAVLWAWASHPVTMDHCLALSEGKSMCMYVRVYHVCMRGLFWVVTEYSKNKQTDVTVKQWSVLTWEGETNAPTPTHTHTHLFWVSVKKPFSELLVKAVAVSKQPVRLKQKMRNDSNKKNTREADCCLENIIQAKWHARHYKSRTMKTKQKKCFIFQ